MNKSELLLKKIRNYALDIPEKIPLNQWADEHRVLPKEGSSEFGQWETERTPYMLEIYKMILREEVREMILQFGAQLAKTEVILNLLAWYIHLDPCPMLVVQPTDTAAKHFSKERFATMIRDCEVISQLVKDPRKKGSDNTITHKMFPGGYVALVGASSPTNLASRPIKVLVMDEIDRYLEDVGKEGNAVELARKRVKTYLDHKIVLTSTPTIKNISKIEKEYLNGSQAHYYLECPSCKEDNELLFDKLVYEISKDDNKKSTSVKMVCDKCGSLHTEDEWKVDNQKTGKWKHEFPDRKTKLSYKLSALAGVFDTWESIVNEYLKVKDDEKELKSFINTVLGETYEEAIEDVLDYELLNGRRETYEAELPEKVLLLTAGADVQDHYIAVEILGHGINDENFGIEYIKIQGAFSDEEVREKLDEVLNKTWEYKDGNSLGIYSTCIDSGGHHTQNVYDYVEKRQKNKRIYAIKGMGGEHIPWINKFTPIPKNKNLKLLTLGVNSIKDHIYSKLKISETGKGYQHFTDDIFKGYDLDYFMELTAEKKVIKNRKVTWEKIRKRNEALDCRVYAHAALMLYKKLDLKKLKEERDKNSNYQIPDKKIKKTKKYKFDKKGVEI